MNETEQALLDAAMRVFSRYGVKRSSMSDLCEEAGVSRQTFYNNFRNKDDILRALIRSYTERALAGIEAGRGSCQTLGAQLDLARGPPRATVDPHAIFGARARGVALPDAARAGPRLDIRPVWRRS